MGHLVLLFGLWHEWGLQVGQSVVSNTLLSLLPLGLTHPGAYTGPVLTRLYDECRSLPVIRRVTVVRLGMVVVNLAGYPAPVVETRVQTQVVNLARYHVDLGDYLGASLEGIPGGKHRVGGYAQRPSVVGPGPRPMLVPSSNWGV